MLTIRFPSYWSLFISIPPFLCSLSHPCSLWWDHNAPEEAEGRMMKRGVKGGGGRRGLTTKGRFLLLRCVSSSTISNSLSISPVYHQSCPLGSHQVIVHLTVDSTNPPIDLTVDFGTHLNIPNFKTSIPSPPSDSPVRTPKSPRGKGETSSSIFESV